MEKVYSNIATWLVKNTEGTNDDFDIYKYGLQTGFEQFIYIITCLTIALILNSAIPMILIIAILFLVRAYIGGFHFENALPCYLFSVATSISILVLSNITIGNKFTFLLGNILLIIVSYVCLSNDSKDLEKDEYKFYLKKLSRNLILIFILNIIMFLFSRNQELRIVCYTLVFVITSFIFDVILSKFKSN